MKENLTQAYKQKPWRTQILWIGRILSILIVVILTIVLHLNITTQAASAGVEIRVLESDREYLEREINNNRTKLAIITSSNVMQERAKELGFQKATAADIQYIYIDEYIEKEPDIYIPQSTFDFQKGTQIKPAYTESIWDWAFSGTLFYMGQGRN